MQRLERQPHPRGGAGGEVLHQDVGLGEQAAEDGRRVGVLQVEAEAFLAAVGPDEVRGQAFDARVVGAREGTDAVPLDLEHARAEVGQLAGAERRRDGVLEGDGGDACERLHRVQKERGSPSRCSAT